MRPGGWDPAARIGDMDIDMVDVHVLFPSYAFLICDSPDADLHVAMIRAYNDWISEFCSYAPDRLYAQALVPSSGVDDAIAEATRVRELPGIRSMVLKTWPNGSKIAPSRRRRPLLVRARRPRPRVVRARRVQHRRRGHRPHGRSRHAHVVGHAPIHQPGEAGDRRHARRVADDPRWRARPASEAAVRVHRGGPGVGPVLPGTE